METAQLDLGSAACLLPAVVQLLLSATTAPIFRQVEMRLKSSSSSFLTSIVISECRVS